MEVGKEGDYTYRYTVTTRMTCIKMGSDESHFNVSVGSDGQRHKTVSTNHNLFEEKGDPKRNRTEVLPLTMIRLWTGIQIQMMKICTLVFSDRAVGLQQT